MLSSVAVEHEHELEAVVSIEIDGEGDTPAGPGSERVSQGIFMEIGAHAASVEATTTIYSSCDLPMRTRAGMREVRAEVSHGGARTFLLNCPRLADSSIGTLAIVTCSGPSRRRRRRNR